MSSIPSTMRALVLEAQGDAVLKEVPVPQPTQGSVLLKVEAALLHHGAKYILQGGSPWFTMPYPNIPGGNSIGRVAALGPDTTSLTEGQLVLVSSTLRARDDPSVINIMGGTQGNTPASRRLYSSTALDGAYAEYTRVPLENVTPLDEARLTGSPESGGLGYEIGDLLQLHPDTLAYAGMKNIGVKAGDRVIVTPSTGVWSGAAVDTALAMGATVFAAGRNESELARFTAVYGDRVKPVVVTGDLEHDKKAFETAVGEGGSVDAVVEVSPPQATGSTTFTAAVSVLRAYGSIVAIGGRVDKQLPVSFEEVLFKNLTFRGQFMWTTEDQAAVARLAEAGLLKLGKTAGHDVGYSRGLGDLLDGIDRASQRLGHGRYVAFTP